MRTVWRIDSGNLQKYAKYEKCHKRKVNVNVDVKERLGRCWYSKLSEGRIRQYSLMNTNELADCSKAEFVDEF